MATVVVTNCKGNVVPHAAVEITTIDHPEWDYYEGAYADRKGTATMRDVSFGVFLLVAGKVVDYFQYGIQGTITVPV